VAIRPFPKNSYLREYTAEQMRTEQQIIVIADATRNRHTDTNRGRDSPGRRVHCFEIKSQKDGLGRSEDARRVHRTWYAENDV